MSDDIPYIDEANETVVETEQETHAATDSSSNKNDQGCKKRKTDDNMCFGTENTDMVIKFVATHEDARMPVRATELSAGFDLISVEKKVVPANAWSVIDVGLKVELPPNCYGRISSRSGLAFHYSIEVGAGTIDADYRGPIKVLLRNFSKQNYTVQKHEKVAQLICCPVFYPIPQMVNNLSDTVRGEGGFNSTGKF